MNSTSLARWMIFLYKNCPQISCFLVIRIKLFVLTSIPTYHDIQAFQVKSNSKFPHFLKLMFIIYFRKCGKFVGI